MASDCIYCIAQIQKWHWNYTITMGRQILHYAAAGGKLDIVELLLDRGLDVNTVSRDGWTPLVCALTPMRGKTTDEAILVAGVLILRGASANARTAEGWSPFHCRPDRSSDGDAAQLARELVARGAVAEDQFEYSHVLTYDAIRQHALWGFRMKQFVQRFSE
jgi:ankyrin repeat protein